MPEYTVASLFAGVGGIDLGFQQAIVDDKKYRLVVANEIDPFAIVTYQQNFEHTMIQGDIEKIVGIAELENENEAIEYFRKRNLMFQYPVDVLTAGFPCQAFSIAGEQLGFEDHRGNLFWSIIEFVRIQERIHNQKPRVLFLENVKNLKNHDNGNTYLVIKNQLELLGYTVKEKVMNTMDYSDIPQTRERIYIVCFRDQADADRFTWFDHAQPVKRTKQQKVQAIQNIIDYNLPNNILNKYIYTAEKYPNYFNPNNINLTDQINTEFEFYQIRRGMYVRHNKSGVCPTLTANMGTGGHNVPLILTPQGIRKLTPVETFKLQGFPIGNGYTLPLRYNDRPFADSYLYKQAGNAVSVPVVKLNAEKILEALD